MEYDDGGFNYLIHAGWDSGELEFRRCKRLSTREISPPDMTVSAHDSFIF